MCLCEPLLGCGRLVNVENYWNASEHSDSSKMLGLFGTSVWASKNNAKVLFLANTSYLQLTRDLPRRFGVDILGALKYLYHIIRPSDMASSSRIPSERALFRNTLQLCSASLQDPSEMATQIKAEIENAKAGQVSGEVLHCQTNLEGVD